ncbi:MAG: HD domain-containing protein [bacterium]|nr:HD domain-containing protein [bacterium]
MKRTVLINDPLLGPIDVTSALPIIDTPLFQRLRFIKQMGVSYMVFAGATHTRFEHSVGSYKRTLDRMSVWLRDGIITEQQARNIEIFGLLHDIGHGPLSHLIESLCLENHDQRGRIILNQLERSIEEAGGNFRDVRALFCHRDPLFGAVHDKNLGTEKFDYLDRDAFHIGYGQRPGVANLTLFVSFVDGELVIDPRAIDEAIQLQAFYLQMYKNVYLRKGTTVLQRMMQKMIGGLMDSGLREATLWEMTDDDLMVEFRRSRKNWIRSFDERFRRRELPKTAISIKRSCFLEQEVARGKKALRVFGATGEEMDILSKAYQDPQVISEVETKLAKLAKLPPWSILLLPVTDPQRFIPKDIKILAKGGLDSLKEVRPDHFRAMDETANSYASVRIATFPEFREKVAKTAVAKELAGFLIENAIKLSKTPS